VNLCDSSGHLISDDVLNTKDANKRKILLLDRLNFLILGLIVLSSTLICLNIFESQGNGSEGTAGKLLDLIFDFLFDFIVQRLNVTILVQVVSAACHNNLGGSLDVKSLAICVAGFNILNDGGHALSLGAEGETNLVLRQMHLFQL
jgi:hypothetical protein